MVRHTPKAHPSLSYLLSDDPSLGLPTLLARFAPSPDSEWHDTAGVFSPEVLSLYPDVAPFPGAEGYSVGYGELIALVGGAQAAVWDGGHWVV